MSRHPTDQSSSSTPATRLPIPPHAPLPILGDGSFHRQKWDGEGGRGGGGGVNRVPRIGTNSRNVSDAVFRFGGGLGFDNDSDRYRTDIAQQEKYRQQVEREKRLERYQVKRSYLSSLETSRWQRMAFDRQHEDQKLAEKQSKTRVGKNSVGYNPITLEYYNTPVGKKLAEEDAKAMHRTSLRAAKLYLKNNTFDPLLCTDIPRHLAFPIPPPDAVSSSLSNRQSAAAHLPSGGGKTVPEEMVGDVARAAGLVRDRSGIGEYGVGAAGMVEVEAGGRGRWSRHY